MSSINNSRIRLHIPGIPYTITRDEYSHDAYTGKVLRFSPMMRSLGFEVYHYGIEGSTSGATKHIDLMTKEEWTELRIKSWMFVHKTLTSEEAKAKNSDPTQVISQLSNWSSPLTKEFNQRFRKHLIENYRSNTTDIVCFPLGRTYQDAIDKLNYLVVETGIGYSGSYLNYRVFESYAWLSSTLGKEGKQPNNYWFVIPNYFNTSEFNLSLLPKPKKIGFLGRINDLKGCRIIMEIAKRFPHVEFILCGQGDPKPYLEVPNIKYKEPIHGSERSDYLGSCLAVLCLSKYLEPFCGVAVEAQLCGTPVISSDWGAMVETVEQGITGLRGHTLADYCHGVQMALDGKFDRQYIRDRAVRLYDMYNVARQYEYVFRTILDVHIPGKNGWYSPDTHIESLLTDKPSDKQARIYICIPYYGAFPNYFQLYLDSLGINIDILTVFLITDIDMTPYACPDNLVVIKMSKADVQKRASKFILEAYNKVVEPENLLKDNYKFVDFKIVYPLLFDDILKSNGVTRADYVGWGDIDLIYGKLSNFIDFKEDYGILGGWHGHFTAIKNTDSFKNNFKKIPNYLKLITDNSRTFITDEIAYREPLKAYLAKNNIKMFYANAHFCDIAPECFYHLSRPDHAEWEKNFYDVYNSKKNIKHLLYDNAKLTVLYDDGSSREALYCHLQKRKMDYSFKLYDKYYILEKEFSTRLSSNIVIVSGHHPFDTTYFAKQTRRTIETYCSRHSYDFYYDTEVPTETKMYALHYRRCQSLIKANKMYPNAQWYIWLDSDVYANRLDLTIESQIDLSDLSIQYHLFHEKVGGYCYPINTGVKIVNKDAIHFEQEIWDNKDTPPWDKFPFEQKAIYEYVLPKIRDKCIIHDPYILNNLYYGCEEYRTNAIFVHMCNIKFNERNSIIRDILSSRSEFSYPSELRIKYGTADIQIDVTDIVIRYHTVNNIMYIPKNDIPRAVLFSDPCVGIYKKIYVYVKDKIYVYDHTTDIYIDTLKSTISANGCITNYLSTIHIVLISYGEPFDTVKKLMMDSVVNYSNNNLIIHDYSLEKIKTRPWFKQIEGLANINKHSIRDRYYWSYKIFCVNEVYEQLEKNDVLFYLDCSQYYKDGFTESIDRLCSIALEKGIIAGSIGNNIKHHEFSLCQKINVWKKVYPECNITILEKPHILASWFLLTKNTTNTQFMNDWIKWSMYTDEEFKDPLITEHVTGDQSIFNMLVYKYDLHVFYDKNRGHLINKDKNGILEIVNGTKDTDTLFIKINSI